MIVYVESNFVLEIAYMQEEHRRCETLLDLAQAKSITLALPAFSVSEPYETLIRRRKQREEIHRRLEAEVRQLARSQPYTQSARELREAMAVLLHSLDNEKQRLETTLVRILEIADIIPITAATMRAAITVQQETRLEPQDAVIYAAVVQHLTDAPSDNKCFVTKNAHDFSHPDIRQTLQEHDCQLLTRFSDALGFVGHHRQ